MSKKKKLKKIDKKLNIKYDDLIKEINDMQKYLKKIDKKAKKRAKKKAGNNHELYKALYYNDVSRAKARKKVVEDNESLFDDIEDTLNDIRPAAQLISRLIAGVIISILSIGFVQIHISPAQMNTLDKIYKLSMKV